jgi:diadenylate cyclase
MVRRIAGEIEGYVVELGTDGRLLSLQLDELIAGVETDRELIARDYLPSQSGRRQRGVQNVLNELDGLGSTELIDLGMVARALGFGAGPDALDSSVSPRGFRLLAKVPRLPSLVVDRLQAVEGVGESRARTVREGLSRLAESSILERYV